MATFAARPIQKVYQQEEEDLSEAESTISHDDWITYKSKGKSKRLSFSSQDKFTRASSNVSSSSLSSHKSVIILLPSYDAGHFLQQDDTVSLSSISNSRQPIRSDLAASLYPSVASDKSKSITYDTSDLGAESDAALSWPSNSSNRDQAKSPMISPPADSSSFNAHTSAKKHVQHTSTTMEAESGSKLTEFALSRVNSCVSLQEEAALTGSDQDEDEENDASELDPPSALSAGIRIKQSKTPSSRILAPGLTRARSRKAVKRRHRQSGLSDKGSKRSNTSGSLSNASILQPISTQPMRRISPNGRPALNRPRRKSVNFLQRAADLDAETIALFKAAYDTAGIPPFPSSHSERPVRSERRDKLSRYIQTELGETPHLKAAMEEYANEAYDSGEDTEMDHPLSQASALHSPLFKSLSLSSIPIYYRDRTSASKEEEAEQAAGNPLVRARTADLGVSPDWDSISPSSLAYHGLQGALTYWRQLFNLLNGSSA